MERNKKMESIFEDIVPYEEYEEEDDMSEDDNNNKTTAVEKREDHKKLQRSLTEQLSTLEKIEVSLEGVQDLDRMDSEFDSIATEALQSYGTLFEKAGTFTDAHAGKAYEVSAQLLKTALDAKGMKLDRKLKTLDLQIKATKLEQAERKNQQDDDEQDGGALLTREQVLEAVREGQKGDSDSK